MQYSSGLVQEVVIELQWRAVGRLFIKQLHAVKLLARLF